MIERRERLDAVGQQFVDQPVVEVEAFRVGRAVAVGEHPWPGDREAIGLDAELLDQRNVFLVAMIVIVGAVAVGAVLDLAGRRLNLSQIEAPRPSSLTAPSI